MVLVATDYVRGWSYFWFDIYMHIGMPNKTLEPTADGSVSSAIAVHAASRRWLSFFR